MALTPQDLQARIDAVQSKLDAVINVWNPSTPATPLVMSYKFVSAQPGDLAAAYSGWTALSADEQTAMKSVLGEFAEVINVRFVEDGVDVPASADPDFNIGKVAFGPGTGGQGGFSIRYSTDGGGNVTSKTWDGHAVFNNSLNLAEASQRNLLLHEFGHAMGLKHPGPYDVGGQIPPAPYLPEAEDNNHYTVMSYNADPTGNAFHLQLMLYDIAALQFRWGANFTTRAGNDVYTGPRRGTLDAIWDGGGTDAIDATGRAASVTIDLTAGHFSTLASDARLAIAYGVAIENAVGGSAGDTLIGNDLANILNGRMGADTMTGGGGNDSYVVDNVSDVTSEAGGNGVDTVFTAINRALGAGLENLTLIGTASISGAGNDGNNVVSGNSGNNVLNGAVGNDTMIGGAGNDTYYVNSALDLTIEAANGGIDTVMSAVNRALGAGLENLTLIGTAVLALGNVVGNRLTGNGIDNTLNGQAGIDTMIGGGGSDTYYVDNVADVAIEAVVRGTDTVISTVNRTLGTGFENLKLLAGATVGIGNSQNNAITGYAGANLLFGMGGIDTLNGGGGADRFAFSTPLNGAGNVDIVLGFSATDDVIALDDAVFTGIGTKLDADEFVVATVAQDAEDRIVYDQGIGTLLFDSDGTGGAAAIRFAILGGKPGISHLDFQII